MTESNNKAVNFYGKIAKFPKNVKASHAYNFLENIKVNKKHVWYIMVEKQDNELQMIKYNNHQGFDLNKFIESLKEHYKNNESMKEYVEQLEIVGNDNFSIIKNIPNITINGKKLISIIMNDLIILLK
jgi:hypothetical protein